MVLVLMEIMFSWLLGKGVWAGPTSKSLLLTGTGEVKVSWMGRVIGDAIEGK